MFHNLFAKNDEFSGQSDVTVPYSEPGEKEMTTFCEI